MADLACFRAALSRENRTLKRALTDPRIVSGVGNAYSDEILHAPALALALTRKLTDGEWDRLFAALAARSNCGSGACRGGARAFPVKVTAFREGMAVHGRYGEACRGAARKSSVSVMRTTKRTTARTARPAAGCSPIAGFPGCWAPTGPPLDELEELRRH